MKTSFKYNQIDLIIFRYIIFFKVYSGLNLHNPDDRHPPVEPRRKPIGRSRLATFLYVVHISMDFCYIILYKLVPSDLSNNIILYKLYIPYSKRKKKKKKKGKRKKSKVETDDSMTWKV